MPGPPPPKKHPYATYAPHLRALDLLEDKWTLAIFVQLLDGPARFVEIQRRLQRISTEQLRTRLNRLAHQGFLSRQRYREVPPRVDYELTDLGRSVTPVIGALARWGFAHEWTEPRKGEAISAATMIRLLPALAPAARSGGIVRLAIIHPDQEEHFTYDIGNARFRDDDPIPAATIAGTQGAWVNTFAPGGASVGLRIDGDGQVARFALNTLTP